MKNSEKESLIKKHLGSATPNWVIHKVNNLLLDYEDIIKGVEQDTNDRERQTTTEVEKHHDNKASHIDSVTNRYLFFYEDEGEEGYHFIIEAKDHEKAFDKAFESYGSEVVGMMSKLIP